MFHNQFHLLKTRRFLPLFITQFLGAFNDCAFKNALIILITYRLTTADSALTPQMLIAIAGGIFLLPFFLFSATAGQLADKFERSQLTITVKFAEVILMILAMAGLCQHRIWFSMGVLFLIGAQATFFGPIKYAILPDHLEEDELVAGNGLIEAGTFIAILMGTVLGGLLVMTHHGEILVSATMLIIALLALASSTFMPIATPASPHITINLNFIKETQNVVRYAQQHWDVYLAILGISWFWLIGATMLTEFSTFAKEILGADEHVVTLLLTLFSIGMALGSLLCNKLLKGRVHATYVPLGAVGISLFITDLFFASHHANTAPDTYIGIAAFLSSFENWRVVIDILLISVCGGVYIVPLYAIMQQRSEKTHRARIIAANNILNALFMFVGAVVTMLLLAMGFSVIQVFLIIALANAIVAVYFIKLLPDVLLKSFAKWLLKAVYRVEVKGLENYYAAGDKALIIANHTSFLDGALLAAFLPEKVTFAINTYWAKQWWIRLFLTMVDAYPLDPLNPMQIKSFIEYLNKNNKCVIFPEGRITVTGSLMKIYEGPALVADHSGAKLLPLCIQGAQYSPFSRLRGKLATKWFPKITLTIFPPVTFTLPPDCKGRLRRQQMSTMLYDLMTDMMFRSHEYQATLFSSLIEAKETHGRRQVIGDDIERKPLTYQQLIMRSFILGKILTKRTQSQEKIGVLLPNSLTTVAVFFALQSYGRIPTMLNFSSGQRNVRLACQMTCVKKVYTSHRFVERAKLQPIIHELLSYGIEVIFLEDLRQKIGSIARLVGLIKSQFPNFFYRRSLKLKHSGDPDPTQPAVILFTSGSEGTPKGVVLSHANIQANRAQLAARLDFTPTDMVLNALPLFHAFGLTGGMLLPILSGVKTFYYPSPLHYRIIPELSYEYDATVIFGTDTFLAGYARYAHPYDFYSLRYAFAGAERLRDETRHVWFQKFGVRIFEGYGATETAPVLAANTPMQNRWGTVGRFLPGVQYQLREVEGISEGHELIVSGPNIMLGYYKIDNPGVLIPPKEGWYETGDLVTIDTDGYLTIKGRIKRFAKIAGEMISLTAAENFIYQLWPKFLHAVVSIPDAHRGEQLILVTNKKDAKREDILLHARAQGLSELATPKKIITTPIFPLLGSGKTNYVEAKALALEAYVGVEQEEILEEA